MLDFYDPRWGGDPRERDDGRPDISRGSRAGGDPRELRPVDPRDVFTERLDLPRGDARARVHVRDREYSLRGSESRTLATVGAFRVVSAADLRDHDGRPADARRGDLRHLRESGLVQTVALEGHREPLVVLTDCGRDLLEAHRHDVDHEPRQTFYAGVRKPRELEHDSQIYDAYLEAAERLHAADARIERVVLDYELKRQYQRFLQEPNRDRSDSDGRPRRDAEEIEEWAREHDLPYFDGHVHFPDVRLEYEDLDGRTRHEDVEVVTMHYRGAHGAAAARSGFSRYGGGSARICVSFRGGGRRGGAPPGSGLAEELLR
jgi:hypothetical protein